MTDRPQQSRLPSSAVRRRAWEQLAAETLWMSFMKESALLALGCLAAATLAHAGPPFATDDPEPVEYRHWEIYLGSQYEHGGDGASGTLPHLEVNYGALPELQ